MADGTVIVGFLSLCGSIIGTFGGILTANKLSNYRIGQLEQKVEKHNSIMERTFKLEAEMVHVNERIDERNQLVDERIKAVSDKCDACAAMSTTLSTNVGTKGYP